MTVARTDLPLRLLRRGKVRDVYEPDAATVLLSGRPKQSCCARISNLFQFALRDGKLFGSELRPELSSTSTDEV